MSCAVSAIQTVCPLQGCPLLITATCRVVHSIVMALLYKTASLFSSKYDAHYTYYFKRCETTINYYRAYGDQILSFSLNREYPPGKAGQCYGIAHDFLFKVSHYERNGETTEAAVKKAGAFFVDGATKKAAQIQEEYPEFPLKLEKHVTNNLLEEFKALPLGKYHVSLRDDARQRGHSMAFVKSRHQYYLLDPNGALLFATQKNLSTFSRHVEHLKYPSIYFFRVNYANRNHF